MSLELDDYFRLTFEQNLSRSEDLQVKDVRSGATHLLEKKRAVQRLDTKLQTQRQEFEEKTGRLKARKEELKKKEDNLKDSLFKFNRFLKENDSKNARGLRKAEAERALIREKEQELQRLHLHIATLLDRKGRLQARVPHYAIYWNFLQSVLNVTKKFETVGQLTGRVETLISTREHLLKSESEVEMTKERESEELRHYVDDCRSGLLQYNNTISKLQIQLDCVLTHGLEMEAMWNDIQSTSTQDTLTLGQIKVVTYNLYHMIPKVNGGQQDVSVDDTMEQLDRIQHFIQDRTDIVGNLRSDSSMSIRTERGSNATH